MLRLFCVKRCAVNTYCKSDEASEMSERSRFGSIRTVRSLGFDVARGRPGLKLFAQIGLRV